DDVAAQHHLHAAAQRMPVDAGDHRHIERVAEREATEAARPFRGPVLEPALAAVRLHIGTGREGALAGAGENDAADAGVALDRFPNSDERPFRRGIDRIHPVRAVDADARHAAIIARVANAHLVAHATTWLRRSSSMAWPE